MAKKAIEIKPKWQNKRPSTDQNNWYNYQGTLGSEILLKSYSYATIHSSLIYDIWIITILSFCIHRNRKKRSKCEQQILITLSCQFISYPRIDKKCVGNLVNG